MSHSDTPTRDQDPDTLGEMIFKLRGILTTLHDTPDDDGGHVAVAWDGVHNAIARLEALRVTTGACGAPTLY